MSFDAWSVHAVSRDSWDWNSFTQVGAVIASSGRLFHLTVVLEFCPPPIVCPAGQYQISQGMTAKIFYTLEQ